MELNKKEIEVVTNLIDMQQFDGAEWSFEGISLTKLKNKINGKISLERKDA